MNKFFDAVEGGDVDRVHSMLAEDPSLAYETDSRPRKPASNQKMAGLLLEGVPKSAQKPPISSTRTALHIAAIGRHTEIARLLIAFGAKLDARDKFELTPLHFAVYNYDRRAGPVKLELVELLIASGADIHARDKNGWTALDFAMVRSYSSDQTTLFETLIRHGASVNAKPPTSGQSGFLLCRAAGAGKPEITRMLIEAGAEVNARSEGWGMALHAAARRGHDKDVELLLTAGADPTVLDEQNRTALDLVNAHVEMIAILDRHAAQARTNGKVE